MQEEIIGENSLVLNNITDGSNYRIVITNTTHAQLSTEKTYEAVSINDLETDLNYYYGLNYVNSNDGTLPSGEYQDIYNEFNLAHVTLSYSGEEAFNETIYRGTISASATEQQSEFVLYKYYPVLNGKVKIELMDNPFTNRPAGKGFNNWVSDDNVGTITFDSVLYKRYIEVDVEYENGKPKPIEISLHASWVDAVVVAKTGSNTWDSVFNNLDNKGMKKLITSSDYAGQSMAGYYLARTLSIGTSLVRIL